MSKENDGIRLRTGVREYGPESAILWAVLDDFNLPNPPAYLNEREAREWLVGALVVRVAERYGFYFSRRMYNGPGRKYAHGVRMTRKGSRVLLTQSVGLDI